MILHRNNEDLKELVAITCLDLVNLRLKRGMLLIGRIFIHNSNLKGTVQGVTRKHPIPFVHPTTDSDLKGGLCFLSCFIMQSLYSFMHRGQS